MAMPKIPLIDMELFRSATGKTKVVRDIEKACKEHGFFYVINHGISEALQMRLMDLSKDFFALPVSEKMKIEMSKGGKAWRGYFPVNGELTSGQPDLKEGLYFGTELDMHHPSVQVGLPMHGQNLFLDYPEHFKEVVLEYMEKVTDLGHVILQGVALSLGLEQEYFYKHYTFNPLILFRIFHYPAQEISRLQWGVGEHTDYGLLTILLQDRVGGLQVKTQGQWIDAPPVPNTFVCNIGDMLDKITGGLYRSTPHRVLNRYGVSRYSFPLFFDPNFNAEVQMISGIPAPAEDDSKDRWDKTNLHQISMNYGAYLLNKVAKVFPQLSKDVS